MKIYIVERDKPAYRPVPEVFTDGNKAVDAVKQEYIDQMKELGTSQEKSDDGYGPCGCYWNFENGEYCGDALIDRDSDGDRWEWRITEHIVKSDILVEAGKKVNEKYTWTEIGTETDDIWRHDVFSSVEECVKDAIGYGIKPGEKIAVGICEAYVPYPSANSLLDQVSEDAYEEVGEVAEGWPEFERWKGYRDIDKLQEKLEKAFNEWLEETNQVPGFYHVQPLADLVMIPEA